MVPPMVPYRACVEVAHMRRSVTQHLGDILSIRRFLEPNSELLRRPETAPAGFEISRAVICEQSSAYNISGREKGGHFRAFSTLGRCSFFAVQASPEVPAKFGFPETKVAAPLWQPWESCKIRISNSRQPGHPRGLRTSWHESHANFGGTHGRSDCLQSPQRCQKGAVTWPWHGSKRFQKWDGLNRLKMIYVILTYIK